MKSDFNVLDLSRLKLIAYHFFTLLTALFMLACSEDEGEFDFPLEGDTLSIADISGNWTSFFVGFQDLELPDNETEVIDFAPAGAIVTLNIQQSGRFNARFSLPQGSIIEFSGQMGFSGNSLVILDDGDSPGDEVFFSVSLSDEDVLGLGGILELDFDEDGTLDETGISLLMTR
ncbi:MAG: hypothetical protein AAGC43_08020 [Bacteroidota bacterium]